MWSGGASNGTIKSRLFVVSFDVEAIFCLLAAYLAEDLLSTHCTEVGKGARKRCVGKRVGKTNRWVLADVLGDAGGISDCRCYLMAHNTGRRGGLRKRASAACEEQLTIFLVFLREEEVGTVLESLISKCV